MQLSRPAASAIAWSLAGVCLASAFAGTARATETAAAHAAAVPVPACGAKPGVKATGTPIILGSIDTRQAGVDFTDVQNMAAAYFACVNANGGVNGHPIRYYRLTAQTNPSQIAAQARKLVVTDHAMGIVGDSSLIECGTDARYWHEKGFYVLGGDPGPDPGCWSTPNSASVSMGQRYSSDGATSYVIAKGAKKIAFAQVNQPGTGYIAGGPDAVAKAGKVPIQDYLVDDPVAHPGKVATMLAKAAGSSGAVVLNFTPPDALLILQAAQRLGLEGKVRSWACSSLCDTDFLPAALGRKWNGRLSVNADVVPLDRDTSKAAQLYRAVLATYGKDVIGGAGSFSQLGFADAELAIAALKTIRGAYTARSVNAAFKAIRRVSTGMICQAFTYGGYPEHVPNNRDYTVTPDNGKLVQVQGCTDIPNADPQIAAYRKAAGIAPLAGSG